MKHEEIEKSYAIEVKGVSPFLGQWEGKNAGGENAISHHYVIENKRGKFPDFRLSILLLKTSKLHLPFHHLDERKWGY